MSDPADFFEIVGGIAEELEAAGLTPVLVGGMALVVLGSRRVTEDFDFVIAKPESSLEKVIHIFYDHGFELASRLDDDGNIKTTIDNRNIAKIRIQLDEPASIFFFNKRIKLRVDLMFDFPFAASELFQNAGATNIGARSFHIASEADLIRMKEVAARDRIFAGDAQDLEFLKKRKRGR